MTKNTKTMTPFLVIHPGELLQDELEARGITQVEFSEIIDRPNRTVNEIIKGKRSITPETAQVIAAALGTTADYWLNMQGEYDLFCLDDKSKIKEQDVKERSALYYLFPIPDLIKRGYLKKMKKVGDLQTSILSLFNISNIDDFINNKNFASFRTSTAGEIVVSYLKAWVMLATKEADNLKVDKYDKTALEALAPKIKTFSLSKEGISNLLTALSKVGVRVVFFPHFSKTRVDGAVNWLSPEKPVIILSLRYDRIDNFYFTLLHEIGHILKHPNTSFWDDMSKLSVNDKEKEADDFASNALGLDVAVEGMSSLSVLDTSIIKEKSFENMVHPGLLVGRLQHEKILNYNQYRQALVKIKDTIPSSFQFK